MRRRALYAVALAFFLAGWLGTGVALAHALLVRSDPAADVVLKSSPARIHLWFTENLNGSGSRIIVWDRYRHVENLGNATVVPGQPRQMEVGLKKLRPGAYLVLWTSVSAEDGHTMQGSYLFFVKHRGPGPSLKGVSTGGTSQGFPNAPGMVYIIAHWIELLAAVTWVGAAAFSALVLSPFKSRLDGESVNGEAQRVRRLMGASIVAMVVASTLVLAVNAYDLAGNQLGRTFTGSNIASALSDEYGQLWIGRQALAILALAVTIAIARVRASTRSTLLLILTVMGFVYMYAFAASGHAASANIGVVPGLKSQAVSLAVFFDWLHFLGDAIWLGGQIYILLVLIPALRLRREHSANSAPFLDTLNRFSPFAYASIAAFTLTGGFSGVIHIPSWYAFFHSVYGWTLVIKIALIGLMMITSAMTVYVMRPQIRRSLRVADLAPVDMVPGGITVSMKDLVNWLGVNPVLGAGVLLATSVLFSYPVPVGLSPAGPAAYTAHAGGLTASLVIKPDRSGPNQIIVKLRNAKGQPVSQAHVSVLTTMLDMVMGTGLAALSETSAGTFSGSTDLGMGGHWGLQLLVYHPNAQGGTVLTRMSVRVLVGS